MTPELKDQGLSVMRKFKILASYLTRHRTCILVYHSISDDAQDEWSVSPQMFAAQMDLLARQGYDVLSLTQALNDFRHAKSRRNSVVLTFDDGYVDFVKNAMPILKKYAFPAILFIVAGEVGRVSLWQSPQIQKSLLDWQVLKEVAELGYEVGSHGLRHRDLTRLTSRELESEVRVSKQLIEDRLGGEGDAFSYPWGFCTQREVDAVKKAGYHCAVVVGSRWENGPETDRFRLERKIMCRSDSLADFTRKVGGHDEFWFACQRRLKLQQLTKLRSIWPINR